MNSNHYIVLGLSPDGIDSKTTQVYTDYEISYAYRETAKKFHPDKVKVKSDLELKAVNDGFNDLKKSFEALKTQEQRRVFNAELKKRPGAYSTEHIFYDYVDPEEEEKEMKHVHNNPDTMDLVLHKTQGVDLTRLILISKYDPSQLLKLAENNLAFADALLNNPRTLGILSISQRFVLLMLIYAHSNEEVKSDAPSNFWTRPAVKQLLSCLQAEPDAQDYQNGLVVACAQYATKAKSFLTAASEHVPYLSYHTSLSLAYDFYVYVLFLFKHHAASLNIVELEFILNKYPENRKEILELYAKSAPAKKVEKFNIYLYLSNAIVKDHKNVLLTETDRLRRLGVESFLLTKKYLPEKKIDFIETILNVQFESDIFNCLVSKETLSSLDNTFSQDAQEKLAEVFVRTLKCNQILFSITKTEIPFFLEIGIDIFNHFLKKLDLSSFGDFIRHISLSTLPENFRPHLINFIFKHRGANTDHVWFYYVVQQAPQAAVDLLINNQQMLMALLKDDNYKDILSYSESFQKLLAIAIAKPKLKLNPLEFKEIPGNLAKRIQAAVHLYKLIEKKSKDAKSTEKETQAEFELFDASFQQVGFFEDLLSLDTQNKRINFALLKGMLSELKSDSATDLQPIPNVLYSVIEKCIKDAGPEEKHYVAKLCDDPAIANLLIKKIGQSLDFSGDSCYINGGMLEIMRTFNNASWGEKYFTAGILQDWNENCFNKSNFIIGCNKVYILFMGIYKTSERELIKSYIEDPDPLKIPSLQEYGSNIKREFKENLQEKYPNNPFSCFISFIESPNFQNKLAAYAKLNKLLLEVTSHDNACPDLQLTEIMRSLCGTGFDEKIFLLLQNSLAKAPELLSGVLFTLTESSTIFLSPGLRQEVAALQSRILVSKPLELIFSAIAMHQIKTVRGLTGGAVAAMIDAHGDKLKSVIESDKSLNEALINTRKLQKILNTVQNNSNSFVQQQTSVTQVVNELVAKFNALQEKLKLDLQQLQNSHLTNSYYAEMAGTIALSKIADNKLAALLAAFPHEDSGNFLVWAANLCLQGDFAKEIFNVYSNNDNDALKNAANTCFVTQGLGYMERNNLSFEDLEQRIGLEKVKIFLADCFKPSASPHPALDNGFDYIKILLKNRRLHYSELASVISNDRNITDIVLENIFIEDNKLKGNIDVSSIFNLYFDENEHQAVLKWLIKRIPLDNIQAPLLNFIYDKYSNASITTIDALFGAEIRNKVLVRNACPVSAEEKASLSASLLKLKEPLFLKTIAHAPLSHYQFFEKMFCKNGQINFLPFHVNGLISAKSIEAIEVYSLEFNAYNKLFVDINWDSLDVAAVKNKIEFMDRFLKNSYITYIRKNIIKRLDNEILRLDAHHAKIMEAELDSSNENKHEMAGGKKGIEKARQLTVIKNEILDEIVNHVTDSAPSVTSAELNNTLNTVLIRKVKHTAELPVICDHRNKIKGFLKGLLGVLLSIPTVFLALLSESYRQTFFSTVSSAALSNAAQDLKTQGPVLGG